MPMTSRRPPNRRVPLEAFGPFHYTGAGQTEEAGSARMSIMPDKWIREMALARGMIEPFVEKQTRQGVISYGLSSYGYDALVGRDFKIFTNVSNAIVDP